MMSPAPQNLTQGLDSRRCALHALSAVLDKNKPLDEALEGSNSFLKLIPEDRAFTQLLLRTTLKRMGQCDALIAQWMERPLPERAKRAQHILRLGLTQILFLGTPHHAAVHTAVELAKSEGVSAQGGLINALLKRACKEGAAAVAAQNEAKLCLPEWLREGWVSTYGEEAVREIVQQILSIPPLDLTAKTDPAALAAELEGVVLAGGTVRLKEWRDVTRIPGYLEGHWWVQDASAALPARLLMQELGDLSGKYVLDLCAAPGGKTAQLVAAGANVTAVDRSAPRMERLRQNMTRLKLSAECVVQDALKYIPTSRPDAILLDAPCSATGTFARHPDAIHLREPGDIIRLASLQEKLLSYALHLLKPGGVVVYSVCSLEPEEGKNQITRLCAVYKGVNVLTAETRWQTEDGQPADGFFVSVMRK